MSERSIHNWTKDARAVEKGCSAQRRLANRCAQLKPDVERKAGRLLAADGFGEHGGHAPGVIAVLL